MDYGKFIGSCLLVVLLAAWEMASAQQPRRVLYATLGYKNLGLFIADGDGTHERALLQPDSSDYNGSFSADGKWIIFTSERNGSADIYRIHPDGTGMERLTDYKGFDDQGALSPDGSTLAFVSTRDGGFANIWLMDTATHRARVLAKAKGGSFRPNWSPDGKWIAFTSDRGTHTIRWHGGWEFLQSLAIYVVHPDGTSLHRLTPIDGYSGSPKWSADGRRILFYQSTPDDVYPGRTGTSRGPFAVSQIVSIDVESGAAKTYTSGPGLKVAPQFIGESVVYWNKLGPDKGLVLASGATVRGQMMAPSWSADGKMVVYDKKVSSGERKMTPAYSIDPKFHMDITGYFASWSPKGDEFVLVEKPGLVIVHARSESPTFSYPTSVLYDSKQVQSFPLAGVGAPAWSPDGSMIAFAVGAGANFGSHMNPARIAVIQPDGTGFRYLTSDKENAGYPSWSPDSKQIVYRVVGSEQGLRIVNLDDDRVTQLTDQADDFPGWSPRGDVIAFTSFRSGGFEIYSIHPDGSDVIRLTHDEGNDAHGSWSPDGEWYIFSSSRAGWKDEAMLCGGGDQPYAGLYAMHGDGTGVRQLTDDQWEDALPAVQPLTQVK